LLVRLEFGRSLVPKAVEVVIQCMAWFADPGKLWLGGRFKLLSANRES
jgi:hypothetical protein